MNITKINVGGEEYYIQDTISGYTSFEWNPTVTSSDVVGTMVFNGISYPVYAPTQSMSNTLDIEVNGTDLTISHGGSSEQLTEVVIANTQQITIPNYEWDQEDDYRIISLTKTQDYLNLTSTETDAINFFRSVKKVETIINNTSTIIIPDWHSEEAPLLNGDVYWTTSIGDFYAYVNNYGNNLGVESWNSSAQGNTYTVQIKFYY